MYGRLNDSQVDWSQFTNKNHRGKRTKQVLEPTKFKSERKEYLRHQLTKYKEGEVTASDFKQKLAQNDIEISPQLSTLFRKNEVGDNVSFLQFGKEIFRQVEDKES